MRHEDRMRRFFSSNKREEKNESAFVTQQIAPQDFVEETVVSVASTALEESSAVPYISLANEVSEAEVTTVEETLSLPSIESVVEEVSLSTKKIEETPKKKKTK